MNKSVKKAFTKVFDKYGRVDCLVNCAGVFGNKTLAEYDIDTMSKVMTMDVNGGILMR